MIRKLLKELIGVVVLTVMATATGYSQVSISGPSCVVPGVQYRYVINGSWNSSSTISACVTGGSISSGVNCIASSGNVFSTVSVIWKDTVMMRLNIQSSSGNAVLFPMRTQNLNGGSINQADRVKIFNSQIASYAFHCDTASGGACIPVYSYQWQRSNNQVNWVNISGATGKDLVFNGTILVNTFFRRVTTEFNAGTVAYSASALLVKTF